MTLPSTSAQNQQQQQSQHFLLKWNNHRTNLVNVFEHLLQHENLVDVTLAVEGKFLKAHKIVLSACSPYFQTMFVQQTPEEKHPILIFHDLKHAHMKTLLEFMYRGEISIDERDLSDVLKIAEALSIRGLSSFESDEEDSMSESPASPQSSVNVPAPTPSSSSAGTSSSNANNASSNATSTNFQQQQQQDYYHAGQSSGSANTSSSSNISQSQLNLDNQISHHQQQSKVSGSKATSSCDSKNTSGNVINGKNQVNAKNIKKEKVKKIAPAPTPSSAAAAVSSATAASFSSIVSGLIMNKANNSNNVGKTNPVESEPPAKKKRGRKPLNKTKSDEKNGISTPVNSSITGSKDVTSKTLKLKSLKSAAVQPEVQIPSRAAMAAVKLKPVRRRIPKRLAETLKLKQSLKRERLAGDLKGEEEFDDEFNGSLESLTSSEPLQEMSVRGLDLFKYAAIEDGVYRCMECEKLQIPKTFKNKYSFQRHAFLYHEGNMRKVFPCPVCFREFSRPDKMKNHLRAVHEGGGNGNGGGGGGKSASSPTPSDFAAPSSFGFLCQE